jgi:diphthamide biosynthesis enzyme Dph1/Dph2-like protein
MKTIFIPAKSNYAFEESKLNEISKKLPKEISICYSIQFKELADEIKNFLSKEHKIKKFIQVLGCSTPKIKEPILLVGSGKFHATSLALETKLPVFVLENGKILEISKKDLTPLEKNKKASYVNYLDSRDAGVLISTKPGQQRLNEALKLNTGKKTYFFLSNQIDKNEFENFGISSWINTACPRMDLDSTKIINLKDLNLSN